MELVGYADVRIPSSAYVLTVCVADDLFQTRGWREHQVARVSHRSLRADTTAMG